jgi:hypothetical protein
MTWLDATQHLDGLAVLNAQHTDRQIRPIPGTGGTMLVGADLLADCVTGGYWEAYAAWLEALPETDAVPVETEEQGLP